MKTTNDPIFIKEAIKTSSDMWFLGWCEANGGNISQRLEPRQDGGPTARGQIGLDPGARFAAEPGRRKIHVFGDYPFLRNISIAPEKTWA